MELPVQVNDLVQVRLSGKEEAASYPSRVDELVGDSLVLSWPTDNGVPVPLRQNQPVILEVVRQDAVYSTDAAVLETRHEPAHRIVVRPSGSVRRIQRREFFRLPCLVPVQLSGTVPASAAGQPRRRVHILSHTVDLSGAGMSIQHSVSLPHDSVFDTKLTLEQGKPPLKLKTRVVHCVPVAGDRGRPMFQVALVFESITEAQRRVIVRHLFSLQRSAIPR